MELLCKIEYLWFEKWFKSGISHHTEQRKFSTGFPGWNATSHVARERRMSCKVPGLVRFSFPSLLQSTVPGLRWMRLTVHDCDEIWCDCSDDCDNKTKITSHGCLSLPDLVFESDERFHCRNVLFAEIHICASVCSHPSSFTKAWFKDYTDPSKVSSQLLFHPPSLTEHWLFTQTDSHVYGQSKWAWAWKVSTNMNHQGGAWCWTNLVKNDSCQLLANKSMLVILNGRCCPGRFGPAEKWTNQPGADPPAPGDSSKLLFPIHHKEEQTAEALHRKKINGGEVRTSVWIFSP